MNQSGDASQAHEMPKLPGFEAIDDARPAMKSAMRPEQASEMGSPRGVPDDVRRHRTKASALWAAYGDALGFISELTDERGLALRTKGKALEVPLVWQRRVGGRSGITTNLPAGCYSDDTQLRLACGRAISSKGFDVEAFAKVELTVWPSYSLGGGRATKMAANNLTKPSVSWFANTYQGWLDAGGNGAAMRIQPHVWAASDLSDRAPYLTNVIKNSVCTHGNPRALFGATFHALCLAFVMRVGEVPSIDYADDLFAASEHVPELLVADPELAELWLPQWQRSANEEFPRAWMRVLEEMRSALRKIADHMEQWTGEPEFDYRQMLDTLGLFDKESRGSGTLTVLASLALAWMAPDPQKAIRIAANAVGSDTDTIATMTGALLGAATDALPDVPLIDDQLIAREADRYFRVSAGAANGSHRYPDLLKWVPPRTQMDVVGRTSRGLFVAGLGEVIDVLGEPIKAQRGDVAWQWLRVASHQTCLIKRRLEPRSVQDFEVATQVTNDQVLMRSPDVATISDLTDYAVTAEDERPQPTLREPTALELDRILRWLDQKGYENSAIGYAMRQVSLRGSAEQTIALTSAIRERLRGGSR